jgi:hypothetical protein
MDYGHHWYRWCPILPGKRRSIDASVTNTNVVGLAIIALLDIRFLLIHLQSASDVKYTLDSPQNARR